MSSNILNLRKEINNKFDRINAILTDRKHVKHVLLIDDDETSNYITETTLRGYGFTEKITIFDNGFDALEYLKGLKEANKAIPELILLDIKMPLMNGFEFLDKCKDFCELKNETEIVLLSSSTYSKDKDKANDRGIEYQTKPLTIDCLNKYI